MKPRATLLAAPTTARYWHAAPVVPEGEDPGPGVWFRFPVYPVAMALRNYAASLSLPAERAGTSYTEEEIGERLPMWAAIVGLCWHDLGQALETPQPGPAPTREALAAYGLAVLDELQEAGVNRHHLVCFFNVCIAAIRDRTDPVGMVGERLDFSAPPKVTST